MLTTAADWLGKTKSEKQKALYDLIHGDSDVDYINIVSSGQEGVFASLGLHFDYAVFGRDSIRVAKDILRSHRKLAHSIILELARLQGTEYNDQREEEPGRIHHEHRSVMFNGQRIPDESLRIMRDLQHIWGGEGTDEMTYYGSTDSTPLYVRLVANYVTEYGPEILEETITGRDGQVRTIRNSVQRAVDWIIAKLNESPWGLLEYRRKNPNGIPHQAWKDSYTSYLHADGSMANYEQGVASIEIQGYAYDALRDARSLLPDGDHETWQSLARHIQESVLDTMWLADEGYFAMGLDRDGQGNMRQIATLTSNPALLLRTGLLHDLEPAKRDGYVEKMVKMLFGREFLSLGGIRARALRHKDMPGYPDYHGTFTTWPKDTFEIAKGLRCHDYAALAHELEVRILNSVMSSGEFYEFFYVNEDGTVWYDRDEAMKHFQALSPNNKLPVPEAGQAWTISAVIAILERRKDEHAHAHGTAHHHQTTAAAPVTV